MHRKDGAADHHKVRRPHTAHPELLKETGALESLTTTLTTSISPIVGGLTNTIRNVSGSLSTRNGIQNATRHPNGHVADGAQDQVGSAEGVVGSAPVKNGAAVGAGVGPSGSNVGGAQLLAGLWATWEEVQGRRYLLVVEKEGVRLWLVGDLNEVEEVVWLRWDRLRRPTRRSDHFHPVRARVLPRSFSPTPNPSSDTVDGLYLAILLASRDRSRLDIVSASTQEIIKSIGVRGVATDLKINDRYLAIGCHSPLSIQLYNMEDLSPAPCSPIASDLAAHPTLDGPTFALGSSRLLAFATSRRPSEREPGVAGRGFSSHHGVDDSPRLSTGGGGGASSSTRSTASSWRDSVSSSAEAVEAARKVGGGLFSGAKALGSWGQQYWSSNLSPENANSPLRAFSRSAPQPTAGPGSMAPLMEDDDDDTDGLTWAARRGLDIGGDKAPKATRRPSFLNAGDRGHVKVVDLGSSPAFPSNPSDARQLSVVAHFSAGQESLALLSFNPSSSFLLTASIEGHFFDIFELRPPTRIGRSATRGYPPRSTDRDPAMWHRYKLYRGVTTAETKSVIWSWDSRVVAVATERGTHHLYAVHPAGGQGSLRGLLSPTVWNPDTFQPLSVSLTAFAKVRTKPFRQTIGEQPSPSRQPVPRTGFTFLSPGGSLGHRRASAEHATLPKSAAQWPSALLFDAASLELTLHSFEIRQAPITSRAGQVQNLSGLSQLMQRKPSGADTDPSNTQPSEPSLAAVPKALWDLNVSTGGGVRFDATSHLYPPVGATDPRGSRSDRWTSFAEIATFSRSLKILPRSIYTTHQFAFSRLGDLTVAAFADGDYSEPREPLRVRQEVVIAPGDSVNSSLNVPMPGSSPTRSKILYGEPIRSAVETVLDAPRPFSPESPSYLAPGFPNGVAGKHGNRWSSAMAITANVKPSIAGAHGRVRTHIGRVYGRGRRASSDVVPPSVSFETDDDAVRVDPASMTSATSLSDVEDEDGDDDGWDAWNADTVQKNRAAAAVAAGRRHVSPVLGPTPFELEDEWDDPVTSKPPSPPEVVAVLIPEPATQDPIQPDSLSTSPLLAVPTVDPAQGFSSSDSDLESKESRFVSESGTVFTAPTATPTPVVSARKKKSRASRK